MEIISSNFDPLKEIYEVRINFSDFIVSREEVELTLGYQKGKIPDHFSGIIDNVFSELHERCEIRGGYRLLDVKKSSGQGLFIENYYLNLHKIVASQLKKSEKAAVFICTIGSTMENWAKEMYKRGDFTTSYIIDTIASVTVECAVDLLHDFIANQMLLRQMKITNRYSPGYCNWDVSEQHKLFSLFPENIFGVTLTESALMLPVKSVSGIIGVGKNVKYTKYDCDRCGVKDCTYRAKRLAEVI